MKKRFEEITIETDKDSIIITQPCGDDDASIIISPEQVDFFVQWLLEAKNQFNQG